MYRPKLYKHTYHFIFPFLACMVGGLLIGFTIAGSKAETEDKIIFKGQCSIGKLSDDLESLGIKCGEAEYSVTSNKVIKEYLQGIVNGKARETLVCDVKYNEYNYSSPNFTSISCE